jgi:hypothetical protein
MPALRVAPLALVLAACCAAPAAAASIDQIANSATPIGLEGADEIVVAPDGKNVYIASNSGEWGAILSFARDPETGLLTQLAGTSGCMSFDGRTGSSDDTEMACAMVPTVSRASDVVVSPDGRTVYTVGSTGFVESLDVWSRDSETGALTKRGCFAHQGKFGCADAPYIEPRKLVLSPDGSRLTVGGGSLVTFRVDAEGDLVDPVCSFRFGRFTGGARTACAGAPVLSSRVQVSALQGASASPSKLFAILDQAFNGLSKRMLVRFALDPATGAITRVACAGTPPKGAECAGAARALAIDSRLAVAPRGGGAYTAGYDYKITDEEDSSGFVRNSAIGVFKSTLGQLPDRRGCVLFTGRNNPGCAPVPAKLGKGVTQATSVALSPDGRFALGGFSRSVVLLKRNTKTQALTPLAKTSGHGLGSTGDIAFSADGVFAYLPFDGGIATLKLGS